jgi:hypothetical protein
MNLKCSYVENCPESLGYNVNSNPTYIKDRKGKSTSGSKDLGEVSTCDT